jgi:hypothetical protein
LLKLERANQLLFDQRLVGFESNSLLCIPQRRDAKAEAAVKLEDGDVRPGDENGIATEQAVEARTTRDSVGKAGRRVLVRLEPLACTGGGPWCGAHSRTGDGCAPTHLDE